MKRSSLFLSLFLASLVSFASAQEETRTWTNTKGQKIEASVVKQEGDKVTLLLASGKEATIGKDTLSAEDQEYLAGLMTKPDDPAPAAPEPTKPGETPEAPDDLPAELPADFKPVPGHPETEVEIDRETIVPLREKFEGGRVDDYVTLRSITTPHFLILHDAKNTKAGDLAQTAEKIYAGLVAQYYGFEDRFGDGRYLLMVASEEESWQGMAGWHYGSAAPSENQLKAWKKEKSHLTTVKDDFQASHGLGSRGLILDGSDRDRVSGKFPAFATHQLEYALFSLLLGEAKLTDPGVYPFLIGHTYFKESLLAGEATTAVIDKSDYARDKFAEKSDFAEGKNWAKTAKSMIAKEEIKPRIGDVLEQGLSGIQPTDFVLMYSLAAFMNRSEQLLRGKNQMLLNIAKTKEGPSAAEFASALGFESVEAFEKEWLEFIASRDFE